MLLKQKIRQLIYVKTTYMILTVIEGWGLAAGCEDCFNPVFHDRIQVGSKPGFHVSELSLDRILVGSTSGFHVSELSLDRIQVSKPGFHVSELSLGSMRVTYAMSEPRSAAIQFCVSKLSFGRIQVGSKPCFHVCKNIP